MSSRLSPQIVNYQDRRTLDTVPGYTVGLQVSSEQTGRVYLTTSETEFALYYQADQVIHYDRELRLVKIAEPNQYWRRGLSNRVVYSRKRPREAGGGLERTILPDDAVDAVIQRAQTAAAGIVAALTDARATIEFAKPDTAEALRVLQPMLERAAAFDVDAARADADRFHELYGEIAVLPPNEYNALVLQGTEGCAYNHCSFCQLYKDVTFRARTETEFEDHVRAAREYHGESARTRRSLFLGDANALALPHDHVRGLLEVIGRHFSLPDRETPRVSPKWWLGDGHQFDGVASFLDVFTGPGHSADGWAELRSLGLRRVHIGMETGCDELLQWLQKPASGDLIRETVTAIKEGGLNVSLILLLGAGGQQYADQHVRDTADVINALPLERGDYLYLSPLIVYHGGAYDQRALSDKIDPLTPAAIDRQEQALRDALRVDQMPGKPYIARYELETFVY